MGEDRANRHSFMEAALKALNALGCASGLGLETLMRAGAPDPRRALVDALISYYAAREEEGRADGFFSPAGPLSQRMLEALNARVAAEPVLTLQRWDQRGELIEIAAALKDGTVLTAEARSVDDLVALMNSASHRTGDDRVFVGLRSSGPSTAYLLADIERVNALTPFVRFE